MTDKSKEVAIPAHSVGDAVKSSSGRNTAPVNQQSGASVRAQGQNANADKGKGKQKWRKRNPADSVIHSLTATYFEMKGELDAMKQVAKDAQTPKEPAPQDFRADLEQLVNEQVYEMRTTNPAPWLLRNKTVVAISDVCGWVKDKITTGLTSWYFPHLTPPPVPPPIDPPPAGPTSYLPGVLDITHYPKSNMNIKICDIKHDWMTIVSSMIGSFFQAGLVYQMLTGSVYKKLRACLSVIFVSAMTPIQTHQNFIGGAFLALFQRKLGQFLAHNTILKMTVGLTNTVYIMLTLRMLYTMYQQLSFCRDSVIQIGLQAASTKTTLVLEVEEQQTITPAAVPSFDEETYQVDRSILVCQPKIEYETTWGVFCVSKHFNDPRLELLRDDSTISNMRTFNISYKLLPELLNQKTLLASFKADCTQEVNRLIRLAESCGTAQDNFNRFLRGRDVYRDTVLFGLMRTLNRPDVSLSLN